MSILRHKKDRNYTTIDNRLLEDKRLSWRAKGIACYLFSKPDGWSINAKHIAACGVEGRDAVQTAMKELEDTGYLVRRKWQNDRGHWNTELELHETAQPTPDNPHDGYSDGDEPDPDEPTPGKPSVGHPTVGQPTLGKSGAIVKTDSVKTEVVKTEVTRTDTEFAADAASHEPAADADGVLQGETWGVFLTRLCRLCYGHEDITMLSKKDKGILTSEGKIMWDAGYRRADLTEWFEQSWSGDWRWKKNKQRPAPAHVRSNIPAIDYQEREQHEERRSKYSWDAFVDEQQGPRKRYAVA